jgi:hypothetical protein
MRFAWVTFVATPLWILSWLALALLVLSVGHWVLAGASVGRTWPVNLSTWVVLALWIAAGAVAGSIARNEQELRRREDSGF